MPRLMDGGKWCSEEAARVGGWGWLRWLTLPLADRSTARDIQVCSAHVHPRVAPLKIFSMWTVFKVFIELVIKLLLVF